MTPNTMPPFTPALADCTYGDQGGRPEIRRGRSEGRFHTLARQIRDLFSFTSADAAALRELEPFTVIPPDQSGGVNHVHVERIELSAGADGQSVEVLRTIMGVASMSPARAVLSGQCASIYHVHGGGPQVLVAVILTRHSAIVLLRDVAAKLAAVEPLLATVNADAYFAKLIRARRMLQASLGLSA